MKEEVVKFTDFIDRWVEMAADTNDFVDWIIGLKAPIPGNEWENEDKVKLRWAEAKIMEAKYEMVRAKDAADLEKYAAEQDLKQVYETLAFLTGKYKVQPWPDTKDILAMVTLSASAAACGRTRESYTGYVI